jgi:ribosomal subunit interface protein
MNVRVNSDRAIEVDEALKHFIDQEVSHVLGRFTIRLTRVELHLSDVDNMKTGKLDKRCLVETRLAGARPLAVSAKATDIAHAVDEALRKIKRTLECSFGRTRRLARSRRRQGKNFGPSELRIAVEQSR